MYVLLYGITVAITVAITASSLSLLFQIIPIIIERKDTNKKWQQL
jgi:hypothetical protein